MVRFSELYFFPYFVNMLIYSPPDNILYVSQL